MNQRFGPWRRIYYVQAYFGRESDMLYIRAGRIVHKSIRKTDGMDIPSDGLRFRRNWPANGSEMGV